MKNLLKDISKTLVFSFISAAIGFGLMFLCGLLFGNAGIASGLELAKNVLLVIGALGLLIVAGMLLKGRKLKVPDKDSSWRQQFPVLNPGPAIGIFSAVILFAAFITDYLLFFS